MTRMDIDNVHNIFEPDLGSLKGKTTWSPLRHVKMDTYENGDNCTRTRT